MRHRLSSIVYFRTFDAPSHSLLYARDPGIIPAPCNTCPPTLACVLLFDVIPYGPRPISSPFFLFPQGPEILQLRPSDALVRESGERQITHNEFQRAKELEWRGARTARVARGWWHGFESDARVEAAVKPPRSPTRAIRPHSGTSSRRHVDLAMSGLGAAHPAECHWASRSSFWRPWTVAIAARP